MYEVKFSCPLSQPSVHRVTKLRFPLPALVLHSFHTSIFQRTSTESKTTQPVFAVFQPALFLICVCHYCASSEDMKYFMQDIQEV